MKALYRTMLHFDEVEHAEIEDYIQEITNRVPDIKISRTVILKRLIRVGMETDLKRMRKK